MAILASHGFEWGVVGFGSSSAGSDQLEMVHEIRFGFGRYWWCTGSIFDRFRSNNDRLREARDELLRVRERLQT